MLANGIRNLVVKMHPKDNVLVALTDLAKGENISFNEESFLLQDAIKAKHKFYTNNLIAGDEVVMYGVLVGKAQYTVAKGSLMTTENVKHAAAPYGYRETQFEWH